MDGEIRDGLYSTDHIFRDLIMSQVIKGNSQMLQGIILRGIASSGDSVEENPNVVKCPKCGSTQVQLSKRGWTLATGFIGSGKQQRVCMNCMYKF